MTQPIREFSEKRDFIRMKIDTPASMTLLYGEETLTGTCLNLSGGGMLAELEKALPLDAEVVITVASEHGHSPMLKARARVSRANLNEDETCSLGLKILEMMN